MESGWFMLIVLAVMGGLIAYLGDKIGSKVGKRKIKLMGLRPKYTSILVTIMTGISIAVVTLGVMSVLSENARVALFGMNKLRQQQHVLEEQRDRLLAEADKLAKEMQEKNDLLADNELKLASQEEQLDGANDRLRLCWTWSRFRRRETMLRLSWVLFRRPLIRLMRIWRRLREKSKNLNIRKRD